MKINKNKPLLDKSWRLMKIRRAASLEGILIPNLSSKLYIKKKSGGVLSLAVFFLEDKPVLMAWGDLHAEICDTHSLYDEIEEKWKEATPGCVSVHFKFKKNGDLENFKLESGGFSKIFLIKDQNSPKFYLGDFFLKIQTYTPFFFLFFLSLLFSYFLLKNNFTKTFMESYMSSYLIIFGLVKTWNIKTFKKSFSMYDPLAKRSSAYAFFYPFLEILLGGLFFLNNNTVNLFLSLFILFIFSINTVGVLAIIKTKKIVQCACVGTFFVIPVSSLTLIENMAMFLMSFLMLFLNVY